MIETSNVNCISLSMCEDRIKAGLKDAQLAVAKVEAQVEAHPLPDVRDFPKPVSPRYSAR